MIVSATLLAALFAAEPISLQTQTLAVPSKVIPELRREMPLPRHRTIAVLAPDGSIRYQCMSSPDRPRIMLKKQP